jgi:DNA polymerase III subunit beta
MKLTIERAALLRSLGHVQSVVERRTTIPILSNLKLDAQAGGLSVSATDMDLSIVDRTAAEIESPGATTAPAHLLYDVVRKLPEGSVVELELQDGGAELTLVAGRSTFTLPCLPADDFPSIGDDGVDHRFAMPAKELRRLIDKTRFAISTEETRYYLNGVYLHATEDGATSTLRGVATDGHRLARVEVALPEGAAGMPAVIVPRKTVAELRKLIDDADDEVQVGLSSSRIQFAVGEAVLRSRLIDGTFPDYERVIPKHNDKILVADTKAFTDAVDRVATVSTDKTRAVKLGLSAGRLTVSAISPDAGRAVEELDAAYNSDALEIGFNARYILDMTAQIDGAEIELAMADAASPTLARDPKDGSAIYVLMPMRV